MRRLLKLIICIFILAPAVFSGTTGKITGLVTDADTGFPLPGANVIIEGTSLGAASNLQGEYIIINVPPGIYSIKATMMGYNSVKVTEVRVSVDLTSRVNFPLNPTVLEMGQEVTIVAERPLIRKDVTSSRTTISSKEIEEMPVESFSQVLELQAGVVKGSGGEFHIRGGRSGEVAYLIDGLSVNDGYSAGMIVSIENTAIQEMEVVSGTFNAEYGQAMSGVVNIVTKEGSSKFSGNLSTYIGDYVSARHAIYMPEAFDVDVIYDGENNPVEADTLKGPYDASRSHLDELDPLNFKNLDFSLSGPIPIFREKEKLTFFASGRLYKNEGWLYGRRIYSPEDSSSFEISDFRNFPTGDRAYVSMNPYRSLSGQSKLAYKITPVMKLTFGSLINDIDYKSYSHSFKYTPEGTYQRFRNGYTNYLTFTHSLSPLTFYSFKASNLYNYYRHYVYEDPLDSRYVSSRRFNASSGYRFYAGGVQMGHFYRKTTTNIYKFELVSQVNNVHQIKSGAEFKWNKIFRDDFSVLLDESTGWKPEVPLVNTTIHDKYTNYPKEFSAYFQDKIELKDMIVNVGVRFEYFYSDGRILSDYQDPNIWLPNKYRIVNAITSTDTFQVKVPVRIDPNTGDVTYVDPQTGEPIGSSVHDRVFSNTLNQPINIDGSATLIDTLTGLPIEKGSMGWYDKPTPKFQVSPRIGIAYPISERGVIHFSYGHFLQIPAYTYLFANPEFEIEGGINTINGNADLEPQRTVSYEIGLQQQLTDNIAINVTGFYKDIRNLLGTEIRETYNREVYAVYLNRDYGNVRGITLAFKKRHANYVSATFDYTYSVAEGNASDPAAAFYDARSGREPEKQMVALNWDQRHTVNTSVTISEPGQWGISIIGQLGSGLPYTPQFRGIRTAIENSDRKPVQFNVDLRLHYDISIQNIQVSLFANIYNLFDIKNEDIVYSDTGRANYSLIPTYTGETLGPNTLDEYLTRLEYYSSPRQIRLGAQFGF